ncbi:MAG: hypothetical protein K6F25_04985 [Bacteroidales bacterium]|nr:hypothetical protein [Bacteroidales bacterium]
MDGLSSIFARNCSVRRITRPEASAFLDANHRLGSTGGRYFYGLFVDRTTGAAETLLPPGTLVAVASFSTPRCWERDGRRIRSYEWIRYASVSGFRVTGGMSRLLAAFVEEVRPDDVMSYADVSWPDGGEAYRTLGFKSEGLVSRGTFTCEKFRLRFDV